MDGLGAVCRLLSMDSHVRLDCLLSIPARAETTVGSYLTLPYLTLGTLP